MQYPHEWEPGDVLMLPPPPPIPPSDDDDDDEPGIHPADLEIEPDFDDPEYDGRYGPRPRYT